MTDYKISLDPNDLQNLIDEPFSSIVTEILGFSLAGTPINSGFETIEWTWQNMTHAAWVLIYEFWATNIRNALPPPYVYIRTLSHDGPEFTYRTYRCKMGKPSSTTTVPLSQIRDATVIFYHCELYA